jgi:hypothetical protein
MRILLALLMLPFTLAAALVMLFERLASALGLLGWLLRLVLLPLFLLSLPAALLHRGGSAEAGGRVHLFESVPLSFDPGPFEVSGLLGTRWRLPSGGALEFFHPTDFSELEPELRKCLEKGMALQDGVRWGGLRVRLFVQGGGLSVHYVAQCDQRCLPAQFRGSEEEEPLADALFNSMRRVEPETAAAAPATEGSAATAPAAGEQKTTDEAV